MPVTRKELEEKFRAFCKESNNLVDLFQGINLPIPSMQAAGRQGAIDARNGFSSSRQGFMTYVEEARTAAQDAVEKAGPYLPGDSDSV